MLTTPAPPTPVRTTTATAPTGRHRPVRIEVRQRRATLTIGAATAVLFLAALTAGTTALWLLTVASALVLGGYLALVARVRRLSVEREMSSAFSPDPTFDWDAFGLSLSDAALSAEGRADLEPAPTVSVGNRDLVRFVAAAALGVVLTPVVGLIRIAGGDLSDLERHGVVDKLVRAQAYGRSQSLRVVAAGLVATAGVTTVGSVLAGGSASAAAVSTTGSHYTVRAGDTLGGIAARFGVSIASLATANHIGNDNLIFVGQVLTIPGAGASSGSSGAPSVSSVSGTYTVVAGDTLSSIATRFSTTVAALASANHITDANLIIVGERLVVGAGAASSGSSGASTPTATGTYTVRAGDTLSAIAARYGSSVATLAALNHLADPNVIHVGEVLEVVGTPSTGSAAGSSGSSGSGSGSSGSSSAGSSGSGSTAPTAGESAAAVAVKVALEQVGKPYVYGGAGPDGFDCSGLVMYAYAAAGVSLPHYSVSQYEDTTRISESQLVPGDLVFYDNYDGPQPGHVAMYIGGGQVVAANHTGTDVQTQSISWDGTIIGFGRVG